MMDYLAGDKPLCAGDGDAKSWSTTSFVVNLVSPIRLVLCIVECGLDVDCMISFGWLLLVPGCGLDYLGILGYLSPGCGRGLFPLFPGCRPG